MNKEKGSIENRKILLKNFRLTKSDSIHLKSPGWNLLAFDDRENTKNKFRAYFLIFNMIFAIIAISYFIGAVDAADDAAKVGLLTQSMDYISRMMSGSKTPVTSTPNPTGGAGTSGSPAATASQAKGAATGNPVGQVKPPINVAPARGSGTEFLDWIGGGTTRDNSNNYFGWTIMQKMSATDKSMLYAAARGGATPKEVMDAIQKNINMNPQYKAELETAMNDPTTGWIAKASMQNAIKKSIEMSPATGNPVPQVAPTVSGAMQDYFTNGLVENLKYTLVGAAGGAVLGYLLGGKNGWIYGGISGAAGTFTYQILKKMMPGSTWMPILGGLAVAALIFLLTYAKEKKQIVEFQCLPWQAPIGGQDCEKCKNYAECSEYTCKSLGQACELVNKGSRNQSCVWKNPRDVNSPTIEMSNVTRGHRFIPDKTIRPPATGVEILLEGGKCIKAFTPLSFTFKTNESAQCKVDYNLTTDSKTAFDAMGYYVGGSSEFMHEHSETLSLPGPDAINKVNPTLANDGTFTLYVRCSDANGNYNVNPFSVRFCVDPGPDTTPPMIMNVSIPSRMPIQFNRTNLSIDIYVNEPADCRWSHESGRNYDTMEYNMSCSNQLWEMNNEATYTCRGLLTGIKDRQENIFYFRCLDKPDYDRTERNPNTDSYKYVVYGTQPLNILKIEPDATVKGATDLIPVNLTIRTDNGYKNGEAICFYSTTGKESDYIKFSETGENKHTQRQDLVPRNYTYYYKCVDLGGNTVYNSTNFLVESDRNMPVVIRIDKQSGELRIVTDKEAECAYSNINCNFEIESGIIFSTTNRISHFAEWKISKNYFVRCMDKNNNQPDPNVCSIVIRPVELFQKGNVIEL